MGNELAQKLKEMGFFMALGTTEHVGGSRDESPVLRGIPMTFDTNNGVTAVYDEAGRPWIIHKDKLNNNRHSLGQLLFANKIARGAYVPHSNDGGRFVREVLPTL